MHSLLYVLVDVCDAEFIIIVIIYLISGNMANGKKNSTQTETTQKRTKKIQRNLTIIKWSAQCILSYFLKPVNTIIIV